jgi:hypothetical protein
VRGWLRGSRVEPRQRRAQRIQPRGVGILVVLYEAQDCRCYRGQLVVGEVNGRQGPVLLAISVSMLGAEVGFALRAN